MAYTELGSINRIILLLIESVSITAVNIFLLITGYFMYKKQSYRISKSIELLIDIIALSVIMYAIKIVYGDTSFSVVDCVKAMIPNNYYIIFYIVVCILAPYINVMYKHITKASATLFIVTIFGMFSIYQTFLDLSSDLTGIIFKDMYTISREGSEYGYTIIHFIMMYCIGAYIARYIEVSKITAKKKVVVSVYVLSTLFIAIWTCKCYYINDFKLGTSLSYCNPLVVISAVMLLIFFVSMPYRENKVVNEISKGSFVTFLISSNFYNFIPIKKAFSTNAFLMVIIIMGYLVFVYFTCYCISIVWSRVKKPFIEMIERVMQDINCIFVHESDLY